MKRLLIVIASALVAGSAAADTTLVQSPAYKECVSLSNSDPAEALAKAQDWLAHDEGISAHHCQAMAYYGLGRYTDAAEALAALRRMVPQNNVALRSFISRQSSAAWAKAKRMTEAREVLDLQIYELDQISENKQPITRLTSDLLLDRARLSIRADKLAQAITDLDQALHLNPQNAAALLDRARVYELQDEPTSARRDAAAVLTILPDNHEAKALLRRLGGAQNAGS